jgi:hypothetical protein
MRMPEKEEKPTTCAYGHEEIQNVNPRIRELINFGKVHDVVLPCDPKEIMISTLHFVQKNIMRFQSNWEINTYEKLGKAVLLWLHGVLMKLYDQPEWITCPFEKTDCKDSALSPGKHVLCKCFDKSPCENPNCLYLR